jgi:hypothetical protein
LTCYAVASIPPAVLVEKLASKSIYKRLSNRYPTTNCTDLVVWGSNLGSLVGAGQLHKIVQAIIILSPNAISVLVGLLLSDAWFIRIKPHWSPKIGFCQSIKKAQYLLFVFSLLAPYCHSIPCLVNKKTKGIVYPALQFETRALPCFINLYDQFITNGTEPVPVSLYDLLTPIALAHWICGDGYFRNGGVAFATDSYSIIEVVQLINVLIVRYNLDCSLFFHQGKPRIIIKRNSLNDLKNLVLPHMHFSFYYKLNL